MLNSKVRELAAKMLGQIKSVEFVLSQEGIEYYMVQTEKNAFFAVKAKTNGQELEKVVPVLKQQLKDHQKGWLDLPTHIESEVSVEAIT